MPIKDSEKRKEYQKKAHAEWYKKNKHKVQLKQKERRQKINEWYQNQKKNLCCIICGESHPACLVFHHRDKQKKEANIFSLVHGGASLQRIKNEIKKCDILCANCHRKHHYEERGKHTKKL